MMRPSASPATTGARSAARDRFLAAHAPGAPAPQPAGTDAGARSYWRIGTAGVLMDAPPAANDLGAWLRMQALLAGGGVRVPRVLARDLEHGFLLLEDLGPRTLLDCLDADAADDLFAAAIDQLLRLQAIPPPPDLPAYDASLLERELDLFPTWFLGHALGLELRADERTVWAHARQALVTAALEQPRVLVHRDFMPRNLMPVGTQLALIDFQDAVTGPLAYDALSLFKDAFIGWPEARVEGWLHAYHARAAAAGLPVPPWSRFRRDADLIGVQRHLKVLGIFARLHCRDSKPRYLRDAPRFLRWLQQSCARHAELHELAALLRTRIAPAWAATDR